MDKGLETSPKPTSLSGPLDGEESKLDMSPRALLARKALVNIVDLIKPATWAGGALPSAEDLALERQKFLEIIIFEMGLRGFCFENNDDISPYIEVAIGDGQSSRSSEIRIIPVIKLDKPFELRTLIPLSE